MFKKIATYFMVTLMALIFLLDILTVALYNHYEKRYAVTPEPTVTVKTAGADRIHFFKHRQFRRHSAGERRPFRPDRRGRFLRQLPPQARRGWL